MQKSNCPKVVWGGTNSVLHAVRVKTFPIMLQSFKARQEIMALQSANKKGSNVSSKTTRKVLLTQRGTRNSGASSYASDP